MIVGDALLATEVRKDFGRFIDSVIRERPAVVRRSRDTFAAISLSDLKLLLAANRFSMTYEQEADGTYSGSIREIDIVANAPTVEALKRELAANLIEYTLEYLDNLRFYSQSANRAAHFPYVMNVLAQDNLQAVVDLIDA